MMTVIDIVAIVNANFINKVIASTTILLPILLMRIKLRQLLIIYYNFLIIQPFIYTVIIHLLIQHAYYGILAALLPSLLLLILLFLLLSLLLLLSIF